LFESIIKGTHTKITSALFIALSTSNVAFKKDHTYVAIKNEDKKAATLIKKIKTNKLVMDKIIANI
jgi:hypothetical protein